MDAQGLGGPNLVSALTAEDLDNVRFFDSGQIVGIGSLFHGREPSLDDLRRHHQAGAAAGFSLKTIKLGGMQPVMDAGHLCEKLGMKVNLASKMAETGISTAALLHLAAALPAVDWGVGLSSTYLTDDVLKQPLAVANGHITVPSGPGLGIEVDEARVRRFAREA